MQAENWLSSTITLYDTMARKSTVFDSTEKKGMKIYLCGLTVYDRAHVGHARTIVFFDLLRRVLLAKGFSVKYVQNFTDVDDKIIDKAKRIGINPLELAQKYIKEYYSDFDSLNVMRPDFMPRATENIDQMIEMIKGLMEKGFAYKVESGVYMDVTKVKDYGKLSKIKMDELKSGARIEPDPYKKNPLDFALWKFYDEPPLWDSPWGKGRPGWHIECSAMVHRYLGEPIDIHGGGEDLLFPHHENEVAQSESLFSKKLSNVWVHVGMVKLEGEKMSKSLGNIVSVRDFMERFGPNLLRYYLLSTQYRKQIEFSDESISKVKQNWRLVEVAKATVDEYPKIGDRESAELSSSYVARFDAAIRDEMNTPVALAELVKLSRLVNSMLARGNYEGDKESNLSTNFNRLFSTLGFLVRELPAEEKIEVESLVQRRLKMREDGKYKEADEVRDSLRRRRIELIDHREGTRRTPQ